MTTEIDLSTLASWVTNPALGGAALAAFWRVAKQALELWERSRGEERADRLAEASAQRDERKDERIERREATTAVTRLGDAVERLDRHLEDRLNDLSQELRGATDRVRQTPPNSATAPASSDSTAR